MNKVYIYLLIQINTAHTRTSTRSKGSTKTQEQEEGKKLEIKKFDQNQHKQLLQKQHSFSLRQGNTHKTTSAPEKLFTTALKKKEEKKRDRTDDGKSFLCWLVPCSVYLFIHITFHIIFIQCMPIQRYGSHFSLALGLARPRCTLQYIITIIKYLFTSLSIL